MAPVIVPLLLPLKTGGEIKSKRETGLFLMRLPSPAGSDASFPQLSPQVREAPGAALWRAEPEGRRGGRAGTAGEQRRETATARGCLAGSSSLASAPGANCQPAAPLTSRPIPGSSPSPPPPPRVGVRVVCCFPVAGATASQAPAAGGSP